MRRKSLFVIVVKNIFYDIKSLFILIIENCFRFVWEYRGGGVYFKFFNFDSFFK